MTRTQVYRFQAYRLLRSLLVTAAALSSAAYAQHVVLPQQDANCASCHAAAPGTASNVTLNDVAGCDYTSADQYDGWGWHNDLFKSCPPIDTATVASGYSHLNSDYRNNDDEPDFISGVPVCTEPGSDSDGDGWGWENNATCIVQTTPPDSNCIDTDGDGWGWDGTGSCRTGDLPAVCVDEDGDGYGWNGTDTCDPNETDPEPIVPGSCTPPADGTTVVSSTGPVRSTGNPYYPDNGPQCVVPDNQFNGPGLGFGDFLLLNNAWNGDKSTWDWTQCISLTENNDGSVSPSWGYDWGNEDDLKAGFQEWEVKSYPEIIYGVKSANETSAPCATTGLPVPYKLMPTIDLTYSYRATETDNRVGDAFNIDGETVAVTGGDRNIAIESFLHTTCEIERGANSNREFELMVWLERGNERLPSGSPPVAVYTDSENRKYDVYVKGDADPGYIAYVAQQPETSGTINWNEFFTDAKNNSSSYGVRAINDDWCLANILFGSEIWWGEGNFDLDYYQIKRSY